MNGSSLKFLKFPIPRGNGNHHFSVASCRSNMSSYECRCSLGEDLTNCYSFCCLPEVSHLLMIIRSFGL